MASTQPVESLACAIQLSVTPLFLMASISGLLRERTLASRAALRCT